MSIATHAAAFQSARNICRLHARSFYFSSFFLPESKRNAAYAVYAFCRLLDDATDEATDPADVEQQLQWFSDLLDAVYDGRGPILIGAATPAQLALQAFDLTVKQYCIPKDYFLEIVNGCRMDLTVSRYETWDDLRIYCYRVAGVVGLIMCKIFGLTEPEAEAQAVTMGEAMQLTNILRDVREDLDRGRIYLPIEDLRRFGYTEIDLAAGLANEPFRALMRFEIARARLLYQTGAEGLRHLPGDGSRFTATAMGVIYAGILRAIERRNYDVFSGRAKLSLPQKLLRLPAAMRVSHAAGAVPNVF